MLTEEQKSLIKRLYIFKKLMGITIIFAIADLALLIFNMYLQSDGNIYIAQIRANKPYIAILILYLIAFFIGMLGFVSSKNTLQLDMFGITLNSTSYKEIEDVAKTNKILLPSPMLFRIIFIIPLFVALGLSLFTVASTDTHNYTSITSSFSDAVTNTEPIEQLEEIAKSHNLAITNSYHPEYPGHSYNVYIAENKDDLYTREVNFGFDSNGNLKSLSYDYLLDNDMTEEENLAAANECFMTLYAAVEDAFNAGIFDNETILNCYQFNDEFMNATTAEGAASEFTIYLDGGGLMKRKSMEYSSGRLEETYTIFHSL